MVNEAEGFARKARYYVEFQLPKAGLIRPIPGVPTSEVGVIKSDGDSFTGFSSPSDLNAV